MAFKKENINWIQQEGHTEAEENISFYKQMDFRT